MNSTHLACYIHSGFGQRHKENNHIGTQTQTNPYLSPLPLFFFLYYLSMPFLTYCWLLSQSGYLSYSLRRDLLWHKRLKVRQIAGQHIMMHIVIYLKISEVFARLLIRQPLGCDLSSRCIMNCIDFEFLGCCIHTDGGPKGVKPSQLPQRSHYCGNWLRSTDGGSFSSPNYPQMYPPNKECLYVLEGNQRHAAKPNDITAHVLRLL